jgi:hypothetical protein
MLCGLCCQLVNDEAIASSPTRPGFSPYVCVFCPHLMCMTCTAHRRRHKRSASLPSCKPVSIVLMPSKMANGLCVTPPLYCGRHCLVAVSPCTLHLLRLHVVPQGKTSKVASRAAGGGGAKARASTGSVAPPCAKPAASGRGSAKCSARTPVRPLSSAYHAMLANMRCSMPALYLARFVCCQCTTPVNAVAISSIA